MAERLVSICTTVIRGSFYALFFFTPLIFTPLTRELFEFPKMIFVYLITAVIFSAALIKSTLTGKFLPKRTPLDFPIFLFLLSYLLSTIISLNKYTSIFGYYTRFNGGLLSVLCFLILYYVFLKEFRGRGKKEVGTIFKFILLSSLLVSLYAIGQHLGLDREFWVQDSQARAFSTLGQPNWLAAYLIMVLPLGLALMLRQRKQLFTIYHLLFTIFAYAAIWFTYSLSGLLGLFGVFLVFFLTVKKEVLAKNRRVLFLFLLVALVISFSQPGIFGPRIKSIFEQLRLPIPQALAQESFPSRPGYRGDTLKIRLLVWKGALNLSRSDPKILLFGTGPETFAYTFLPFRPREMNLTSEWDFLYNKAHNHYLDIIATRGIIGLMAILFMISRLTLWVIKRLSAIRYPLSAEGMLTAGIYAGWVGLLVTNFFGWPTVATSLLFWLYPAMAFTLAHPSGETNKRKHG